MYVIDNTTEKVLQYSLNGELLHQIGGNGWGNYEFNQLTDICVTPLHVYVVDYNNKRIQQYDKQFNYIQTLGEDFFSKLNIGTVQPRATTISQQGEMFILDSESKRILKFNSTKNFEKEFGNYQSNITLKNPISLVGNENTIFLLDENTIVLFDIFGNYLSSINIDSSLTHQNISIFNNTILLTTSKKIIGFSLQGEIVFSLSIEQFSSDNVKEFKDVVGNNSSLYILTPNKIIVTPIP